MNEQTAFHISSVKNLVRIKQKGLIPSIPKDMVDDKAIYLFKTKDDAEQALMNWLGDRFNDDDEVVLLTIDITGLKCKETGAAYEIACHDVINAKRIKNIEKV